MALRRDVQRIIAHMDASSQIVEYDYSLNLVRTLLTYSGGRVGAFGVDQSGTYLIFVHINKVSTTDFIVRLRLSDLAVQNIVTIGTSTNSIDTAKCVIDEAQGIMFLSLPGGSSHTIYSSSFPGGSPLTLLKSGVGEALFLDRNTRRVGYSDLSGNLRQMDYAGGNDEVVFSGNSCIDIRCADNGLN